MDALDEVCLENKEKVTTIDPLEKVLTGNSKVLKRFGSTKEVSSTTTLNLELNSRNKEQEQQLKLELKQLPTHLKYVSLEENGSQFVILCSTLRSEEETRPMKVLKANKDAISWTFYLI